MRRLLAAAAALALVGACAERGAQAQDLGAVLTTPGQAPVPQVARSVRPGISAADPARLLVIGDSLADGFGQLLEQRAPARDLPIRVTNRGRVSTGLSRADYYNWPDAFEDMVAALDPDIVVAHFGANDMQTILAPEGRTGYGTEDWEGAYREQIRKILEVAARAGVVVYWIGPGPDGNANLDAHLARVNPYYEDEVEAAGGIFFPLDWTAGPGGAFARSVEIGGETVAMRTSDGSHFTGRGYAMVADRLLDDMIRRWPDLGPSAPLVSASADPMGAFALQ